MACDGIITSQFVVDYDKVQGETHCLETQFSAVFDQYDSTINIETMIRNTV